MGVREKCAPNSKKASGLHSSEKQEISLHGDQRESLTNLVGYHTLCCLSPLSGEDIQTHIKEMPTS